MIYDRWTLHIEKVTTDFLREFGSLTPFELNWKPKPNAWSIAQNIDHLIMINDSYFRTVHALRDGEYKPHFLAKFGFIVERVGQYILDEVQPYPVKKVKTFPIWQPSDAADSAIFQKFEHHQDLLIQLIRDSYELLDREAVISSPANRLIVYKLSTAFDIIIAHEKRHFAQCQDVFNLLRRKMATK